MFDSFKTYLAERKVVAAEKKAIRLEDYANRCRDEETLRWGPPDADAADEHGQSVRAIVHRYQRCVGVSLLLLVGWDKSLVAGETLTL